MLAYRTLRVLYLFALSEPYAIYPALPVSRIAAGARQNSILGILSIDPSFLYRLGLGLAGRNRPILLNRSVGSVRSAPNENVTHGTHQGEKKAACPLGGVRPRPEFMAAILERHWHLFQVSERACEGGLLVSARSFENVIPQPPEPSSRY